MTKAFILTRKITLFDYEVRERAYEGIEFENGVIILSDLQSKRMMTFFHRIDFDAQFGEKNGYEYHLIKKWNSDTIRIHRREK